MCRYVYHYYSICQHQELLLQRFCAKAKPNTDLRTPDDLAHVTVSHADLHTYPHLRKDGSRDPSPATTITKQDERSELTSATPTGNPPQSTTACDIVHLHHRPSFSDRVILSHHHTPTSSISTASLTQESNVMLSIMLCSHPHLT